MKREPNHNSGLVTELSPERRQHLDYLQSAIVRMASASATAKTWLLPVVTASLGYAIAVRSIPVAILGIFAVSLFAVLDARYLREERAFRALFKRAAHDHGPLYDMNARAFYGKPNGDPEDLRELNCRWRRVFWSWSVAGFYIPIAIIGLAIIVYAAIPVATPAVTHP